MSGRGGASYRKAATLAANALLAAACSGGELTAFDCSPAGRKARVAEVMSEYYLWYDHIPESLDYAAAESPQALMREMTFGELDHWSGMQELVERQRYFDEGRFLGLGYSLGHDADGGLRVSWVHEGSSAGRAGLDRGALLLTVNDLPIEDLTPAELGAEIAREEVRHTVRELDGSVREVTLQQDDVTITSVKSPTVIDAPGGKVGYFMFTTFVLPGEDELKAAFAELSSQGVERLVVDLRYNGGGLLRTAALLGSLIAADAAGRPLIVETYNDKHPEMNRERSLFGTDEGLSAERVVFLTGRRTASASEQVINGLRPYLPVQTVGETTLGKPVGSDSWQHCNYAIAPITFHSLNANGEGDYFQGMAPTCPVPDDLTHRLGDPEEAQLAAALSLLSGQSCEALLAELESTRLELRPKARGAETPPARSPRLPPGPVPEAPGWY